MKDRTFVNFLLDRNLRERFAVACKINDVNMSELLRKYVLSYLDKHEKKLSEKLEKKILKGPLK